MCPGSRGPATPPSSRSMTRMPASLGPRPYPSIPKSLKTSRAAILVSRVALSLSYTLVRASIIYYYNFCPVCLRSSFVIWGDFCRVQCTVYLLLGLKTAFRSDLFGVKIITLPVLALTSNRPSISQNFFVPYVSVISSVYCNVAEPEPPIFCRSHHF